MIHLGYEVGTGEAVAIEQNHTFVGGTTGTGKSEMLNALIKRSKSKFLILDVKTPRDYMGYGADIPLYLQQRMQPLTLKNLIESTERLSMKKELPELSRLCRRSKTWEDLLVKARERQADKKTRDYYKDVLETIILLFERLVDEFNRYTFAKKVVLKNKVNVMNLSHLSDQLQQMIVSSVLQYVQKHFKDVTVVVDEAHRFVPQAAPSAARHDVIRLIREGRANRLFMWLGDQTVTGIDKQLMKQMQIWCLGRQMELNEAERTLKQIPQRKSLGLTIESIQTLGLGEFIVITPKWAKRTYIQPTWVTEATAKEVALGTIKVEHLVKPSLDEDEEMWKKKYEELARENSDLQLQLNKVRDETVHQPVQDTKLQEEQDALRTAFHNLKKDHQEAIEQYKQLMKQSLSIEDRGKQHVDDLQAQITELEKHRNDPKPLKLLAEALAPYLNHTSQVPREGQKIAIHMNHAEVEVAIHHTEKVLKMTTETTVGKVMYIIVTQLNDRAFTTRELSEHLHEQGWNIHNNTLSPTLGGFVKEGKLIRVEKTRPTKFRLPSKAKVKVTKA